MIEIRINSEETDQLLAELRRRMRDLRPVMEAVGQVIQSGTQQRFIDQEDPEGNPWAPLKPSTIALRRRGPMATGSIQILRDTGRLMNSISYRATSKQVAILTNVAYAGTHQFGYPRRNIPARPFFGYSASDQAAVVEVLNGYIQANQTLSWWERLVAGIVRLFRP
jgi:phage virion morphogenesis protein